MWRLLQTLIIGGVSMLGVYYNWSPNPYVAPVVGVLAAFVVTWTLSKIFDLLRLLRARNREYRTG